LTPPNTIAGLSDRSRQVHSHPWRIPAEVEELICELRRSYSKWGPRRLVFEVGRRGHQVTRFSVYRALVRNGLIQRTAFPPSPHACGPVPKKQVKQMAACLVLGIEGLLPASQPSFPVVDRPAGRVLLDEIPLFAILNG
jgi:Homeodomain-like domain